MTGVIILAAGSGKRMNLGYNKMLITIDGVPLYQMAINRFKELGFDEIVLVKNPNDDIKDIKGIQIINGGYTRQESVYNGLKLIRSDNVLIHDGSRPFVSVDNLNRLEQSLETYNACCLSTKVKDTIKDVSNGVKTLNRKNLIAVQTPQGGRTNIILECYEKALKEGFEATDDMSLVERYTNEVIDFIDCDYYNIKITTKEDLDYALYLKEKGLIK